MILEELQTVDAPSDASFWAGVGIGTVAVVAIGWVILC